MRKVLIALALLVTTAFMVGGGFIFVYSDFTGSAPQEPGSSERAIIERLLDAKKRFLDRATVEELKKQGVRFIAIPKGFVFAKAADRLESEGIISSALLFRTYARVEKSKVVKRGLKAGDFAFHPGMTPPQVFDVLFGEPLVYVERVTIPEGFNLREIAARMEEKGICKKDEFLKAAYDEKLLKKYGIASDRAEGYLFPDTYDFKIGEKAEIVVSRMIQKFKNEWLPLWEQRSREMGLDRHKAVTLASIIEKETGQKAERELVSSVFHNRRRLNMPMQTDPTTCYAIAEVEGWPEGKKCNITSSNKLIRNPYNTYYVRGFPPGPIASPGRKSLRAAVFPAQSRYLFFVSRNDGTHVFSEKYSTHAGLVKTWQQDFFRKKGQAVTSDDATKDASGDPANFRRTKRRTARKGISVSDGPDRRPRERVRAPAPARARPAAPSGAAAGGEDVDF